MAFGNKKIHWLCQNGRMDCSLQIYSLSFQNLDSFIISTLPQLYRRHKISHKNWISCCIRTYKPVVMFSGVFLCLGYSSQSV